MAFGQNVAGPWYEWWTVETTSHPQVAATSYERKHVKMLANVMLIIVFISAWIYGKAFVHRADGRDLHPGPLHPEASDLTT